METTIKNRFYLVMLILSFAFIFTLLFQKCENEKVQLANVNALNAELKQYKLSDGQKAFTIETLKYNKSQLKNLVLAKDQKLREVYKKFSNVKTITKEVTTTLIDTITIAYRDTIPCVFNKQDSIIKKDYSLNYNSTQKGISINNLKIPDTLRVITGEKRKWFLGAKTPTIDITHSNPLIQVTGLQHYELNQPKRFYETTVFKFASGVLLGAWIFK